MSKTLMILDNPQKHFRSWPEALAALCRWCREYEVGLSFNYDPGWSVKRVGNEWGEPELNEDERGYRIEIGGRSFADDDGSEAIYPKPSYAVYDGLRLLKAQLEREG